MGLAVDRPGGARRIAGRSISPVARSAVAEALAVEDLRGAPVDAGPAGLGLLGAGEVQVVGGRRRLPRALSQPLPMLSDVTRRRWAGGPR